MCQCVSLCLRSAVCKSFCFFSQILFRWVYAGIPVLPPRERERERCWQLCRSMFKESACCLVFALPVFHCSLLIVTDVAGCFKSSGFHFPGELSFDGYQWEIEAETALQHYRAWTKLGTGKSWSLTEPGSKIVACLAQEEAAGKCEPRRYEGWIDPGTAQKWCERVGYIDSSDQWWSDASCWQSWMLADLSLLESGTTGRDVGRWKAVRHTAFQTIVMFGYVWIEREWTHIWIEWMNMIN